MHRLNWEELAEHFERAGELLEGEREAYLARLDATRPDLAAEIRRALASAVHTSDFLDPPSKAEIAEPLRMLSFDFRGMKLGEFELVREIGRGASGVVYLGLQRSLDRKVAIKILSPHLVGSASARERFHREARAASSLRHDSVVNVLSFGEQHGAVYLVLEFVEGQSLQQHLEVLRLARGEGRGIAAERDVSQPGIAASIVLALAEGLEYCHNEGVLHRDIKPHNILIEEDLSPRIVDFGLAKDMKAEGITEAGLVSGTLHYMSPEQAQARSHDLDARSDVYSLGVVLYEMLTLRRPFDGTPEAELVQRVLRTRPVPPHHVRPGLPRALSAVCMRALQKRPDDRYASAAEFARDLRAFLRGSRVAVGARLRFEDAYRYVFIQRPWIGVMGLAILLASAIALAPHAEPVSEPVHAVSPSRTRPPADRLSAVLKPEPGDSPELKAQKAKAMLETARALRHLSQDPSPTEKH